MSSPEKKIKVHLTSDEIVQIVAQDLAFETITNEANRNFETNKYTNILTGESSDIVSYVELIEIYKTMLTPHLGKYYEIPEISNRYPVYSFDNSSYKNENAQIIKKLVEEDFRRSSQEEFSENDMKLQSLLMMRQYLRMIRRLVALTYFYNNKGDEFTTFTNGKIRHKYFDSKPMVPAIADRIATNMYLSGFQFHQKNNTA